MTRPTLSLRSKPATQTAPVATSAVEPTCYARSGTEVIFNGTSALITHDGAAGQTETDVAANVDALFYDGAFAELRKGATFMVRDGQPLDDAGNFYSLIVDAATLATIEAQAQALEAAGSDDDGFVEDAVFSGKVQAETPVAEAPISEAPAGDEVELDLSAAEVTYATTRNGAPYATVRTPGARTTMAFGPVAEALRGLASVSCIVSKGRSTDKIVAVRLPGANDLIVEQRAA